MPKLGESLLTWKGRSLYPPSDSPLRSVLTKLDSVSIQPGTLVFVPSPLECLGIRELVERLPEACFVVLYEADEELRSWSRDHFERIASNLDAERSKSIAWLDRFEQHEFESLTAQATKRPLRRFAMLRLNGGWLLNASVYRHMEEVWERELQRHWSNRMTSMKLGSLWVRHWFRNLPEFARSRADWPDWGDCAVVVCGAGPSLELHLETLKRARSRIRILAVDTALSIFSDAGIVPDAVVCVESQVVNLKDFSKWKNSKLPLFLDLTAHPSTTRVTQGPIYWFASRFADVRLFDEFPVPLRVVPPLGSVGVAAVRIALSISRGVCFLAGLDFSYPIGKTHARSAPTFQERRIGRLTSSEQIGSWLREGVEKTSNGCLTTHVMSNYAALLSLVVRDDRERAFVLETPGIDLGLTVIPRSVDWTKSLVTNPNLEPVEEEIDREDRSSKIVRWLEGEIRTIGAFLDRSNEPSSETIELLRSIDYVYFSFPDAHRIERPDSAWIARCRIVAQWLRRDLEAIRELWARS